MKRSLPFTIAAHRSAEQSALRPTEASRILETWAVLAVSLLGVGCFAAVFGPALYHWFSALTAALSLGVGR